MGPHPIQFQGGHTTMMNDGMVGCSDSTERSIVSNILFADYAFCIGDGSHRYCLTT